MFTSVLRESFLRKSKRTVGGTGSHAEETEHMISPIGSPGSSVFSLDMNRISSPDFVEALVHVRFCDALMAWQKLIHILCANLNTLLLPARVVTPAESWLMSVT